MYPTRPYFADGGPLRVIVDCNVVVENDLTILKSVARSVEKEDDSDVNRR